jgi:hypothetical protein
MKTMLVVTIIIMMVSFLAVWFLHHRSATEQTIVHVAPDRLESMTGSARRSFLNDWQVTPQHDDRTPMLVVRPRLSGYAPADRSTARRGHQRMYRQWSGERHD